jgi:hypothetical protein
LVSRLLKTTCGSRLAAATAAEVGDLAFLPSLSVLGSAADVNNPLPHTLVAM